MRKALDGWILVRAPASPAQGLHRYEPRYFSCSCFCFTCSLEKLQLVDQHLLERDWSALLLRVLAVGRRQQSELNRVALDIELGGLMNCFDICRDHFM